MVDDHQVAVAGIDEDQEQVRRASHGKADAMSFERLKLLPQLRMPARRCVMAEPRIRSCHQPEFRNFNRPVFFNAFDGIGQIGRHPLFHIHGASSSARLIHLKWLPSSAIIPVTSARMHLSADRHQSRAGIIDMQNSNNVEAFLASYPADVGELARSARRLVEEVVPGAEENLDESAKVIGYGYGPGYKGVVCTLILSRTGVKLGIPYGAAMADPKGLLRGAGKVHRHIALQTLADLKQPGVKALLKAALAGWKERTKGKG